MLSRQPSLFPPKQLVPRQALPSREIALVPRQALPPREIAMSFPRQSTLMPRQPAPLPQQSALTPRELVLSPLRQTIYRQLAMTLTPREIALFPCQVVPGQSAMALTPREIMPFPLKQVVPSQKALLPRQPALLPKQSALTLRGLVQFPQATQPSSQANNVNSSPNDNSLEDVNPKWFINLSSKPLTQAQRSVLAKGPNFVITPKASS